MSASFSLAAVPGITSGPGSLAALGDVARGLAGGSSHPVLLVADPGLRALGITDRAVSSVEAAGLRCITFEGFKSDPTVASVDEAVASARDERAAVVVCLGGGSAMDVGKLVAAVAVADTPTSRYALCAEPFPSRPLPSICVPTTHGTGSETTRTSVVSDAEGMKLWYWGDELRANRVILDAELTIGLPPALTAATGIDALIHALEAATNRNATFANDLYCLAAIRLVSDNLLRTIANPADLDARGALLLAAAWAGVGIDNAGTAIAHNIGHALASLRPIHHGRAVGLALLATLPWSVQTNDPAYAAVAEAMGGPREAAALPGLYERLLRAAGVKVSLFGEGYDHITPERLAAEMVAPANLPMLRSSRREATDADRLRFARTLLTQE